MLIIVETGGKKIIVETGGLGKEVQCMETLYFLLSFSVNLKLLNK